MHKFYPESPITAGFNLSKSALVNLNGDNAVESSGAVVSMPNSAPISGAKFAQFLGAATDDFTTADSAANSITSDIDIRAELATSWIGATDQAVVSKYEATKRAYMLRVESSGVLRLFISNDGTTSVNSASTAAVGFDNGAIGHIRATWSDSGDVANFYTSEDGETWNLLGDADVALVSVGIADTGSLLYIGTFSALGDGLSGSARRVRIYNGINQDPTDVTILTRRNLLTYSQEFDNAAWPIVNAVTVGANAATAPDGTLTADSLEDNSGSLFEYLKRVETVAANSTKTLSLYVKKATGTPAYPMLRFLFTGSSDKDAQLIFNEVAGTWSMPVDTVSASVVVTSDGDYWRVAVSGTDTGSNTTCNIYLYAAASINGTSLDATKTGTIVIWGAQFEDGLVATDYQRIEGGVLAIDLNPNDQINDNTTWTSSETGELWTTNGNNYVVAPRVATGTGVNYGDLPGSVGDRFTAPSAVANQITSDIDIRVRVAMDDWTPAAQSALISKWEGTANQRGYFISISTAGLIQLSLSETGAVNVNDSSSVATGFTDGTIHWVRAAWNNTTNEVLFYTSDDTTSDADSVSWTQLGAAGSIAVTGIFASTQFLEVGAADTSGLTMAGKIYAAAIYNGTTKVVDFSPVNHTHGTTFNGNTGETWTATGNAAIEGYDLDVVVGTGANLRAHPSGSCLIYPANGNYISSPDSVAASILGDIEIIIRMTSSGTQQVVCTKGADFNPISYLLRIETDQDVRFWTSADGSTVLENRSTVGIPYPSGQDFWLKVTLDVNDGAGNRVANFYTSAESLTDPTAITFSQLGTTVTTAGATSIFDSDGVVSFGATNTTSQGSQIDGLVYRGQIYNGIDGTLAVDFNAADAGTNARRNLLTYSQEFDNAIWVGASATRVSNAATAPDGTLTADLVYPASNGTYRDVGQQSGGTTAAHTYTVRVKYAGFQWVFCRIPTGGGAGAWFDLLNGVVGTTNTFTSVAITALADGWYELELKFTGAANAFCSIGCADADNSITATVSGTDGVYVWGAQTELGSAVSAYQRVDNAAAGATFISSDTFEGWELNGNSFIQNTSKDVVHTIGGAGLESTAGQTIASGATVFMVFRMIGTPAANFTAMDSRSDSAARFLFYTRNTSSDKWTFYQGTTPIVLTEAYDELPHVATMQVNGDATTKLTVSNVGSVTADSGTTAWDYGSLMIDYQGNSAMVGYTQSLLVFNSALSDSEVASVQAYLASSNSI